MELVPEKTSQRELFLLVAAVLQVSHHLFHVFLFLIVLNSHHSGSCWRFKKLTSFTTASLCCSFMWGKSNLRGVRYYHFYNIGNFVLSLQWFAQIWNSKLPDIKFDKNYHCEKHLNWSLEWHSELGQGTSRQPHLVKHRLHQHLLHHLVVGLSSSGNHYLVHILLHIRHHHDHALSNHDDHSLKGTSPHAPPWLSAGQSPYSRHGSICNSP